MAGGISQAIVVLGALALGAQRLLPVLQQAYGAWVNFQGNRTSLQDALQLFHQPLRLGFDQAKDDKSIFQSSIELKNISFSYAPQLPWILKNINLSFKKGDRIGFIGKTGSGKSTLLDILMGLLEPSTGSLVVDGKEISFASGRNWQAHIAHVPQFIYLSDQTIAQNIAFGVSPEEINYNRVVKAAQQAQISDVIDKMPDGYQTLVGERGVRLSGGQRQRLGIARALYKQADVIIFDEATSALDDRTEQEVMRAIEELGDELTIFMVAHRLSTLRNCTQIVALESGTINRIGSYHNLIG